MVSDENSPVEVEQGFGAPNCPGSVLHHSPGWPRPPIGHPMGLVSLPVLRTLFTDARNQTKERWGFKETWAAERKERTWLHC